MARTTFHGFPAYDFSSGVDISPETQIRWIKETIERLDEYPCHNVASGNFLVMGVTYPPRYQKIVICSTNYVELKL